MSVNNSPIDFSNPPCRRAISRMYAPCTYDSSKPLVSVITPYFNTDAIFLETVTALKSQSLQNWEWIVVDDGSTDVSSVNRLKRIANEDDRIKIVHQENAGPASARNTAFRNSTGLYICMLDSDDMIEQTYLEKCVCFLESYQNIDFCNSYSVVFGDQEYLWTTGFETGATHTQRNSGPPISVIRRSAFEACGGFDESIRFGHEDWDFWLAMAKVGRWGRTLPEFLQWYRKRGGGRFEQIMNTEGVNEAFEQLIQEKYEGLSEHFPVLPDYCPIPYESVETQPIMSNRLKANTSGRRIMFIVPWMVVGGADRVNLDLIEGLTGQGHDVTICATLSANHNWEHEFRRLTPDIFVFPNFLKASDFPRFIEYLICSRQIDTVIVSGSTIGYQLLPYLRSVAPEVAFLDMCHVEEEHWQNGGHPRFGVGYQDVLDLNITTTQHLADWMQNRGADGKRIKVMYTGVKDAKFSNENRSRVHAELGLSETRPVIVFAGRLCEQKRPAMLAEILKEIYDAKLRFYALIIGDGELRQHLESLICEYRLTEHVFFLGAVPHGRWLDILSAADVLLMPSRYEGISIALLEALAAGVVPVVAKVGGQDEIVDLQAGVLVSPGDGELSEYVNSLQMLLSNAHILSEMSSRCKNVARSKLS